MPEIRRYTVIQKREVKVTAHSHVDAIRLATAAFEHGQNSDNGIARDKSPEGVWGNTSSRVKELDIYCERTS